MEFITKNLSLILPLIIIELGLTIASLIHVLTHKKYKFGNRILWILVSFLSILGPVVYFVFGRGEEE